MKAFFIILNDLDHLEDVLEKLVSLKVHGATILDSQGMAQAILNSDSGAKLFMNGPFFKALGDQQRHNKTIFSVVKDEKVYEIAEEIKKILIPSEKPAIGFMFSIPVDDIFLIKRDEDK